VPVVSAPVAVSDDPSCAPSTAPESPLRSIAREQLHKPAEAR
jgi:hypothetical protein